MNGNQLTGGSFAAGPVPIVIAPGLAALEAGSCEQTLASEPLSVQVIDRPELLARYANEWDRLAGDVPFRQFVWAETWWRHYATGAMRLCVLVVSDSGGRCVGVAPWYIATGGAGRVLRMLGSGDVCSEHLTLLSAPRDESVVAAAVAKWLTNDGRNRWDLLELEHLPSDDPAISALCDECAAAGLTVHERPGMNIWSVNLAPTWDQFVAELNSSRRAKIRQSLRKFFDNGKVATRVLTDPDEFERRFGMLVDLHQRRRHSLGQPGCFASEQFSAFHREIARRLLRQGQLRLVWTDLDGRPIAAEYSLLGGGTVYYYQTGLEPDAIDVGPGWLGMIGSLRLAIGAGYRRFDFLRGDEPYKASWGAMPLPTRNIRIVPPRTLPRLRHAAWLARHNARGWLKRKLRANPTDEP